MIEPKDTEKDSFSQPYKRPDGTWVQRNFKTGRLVKVPAQDVDSTSKELESLKSDFMQQIGRYYSAKRGVGQFVPDPNKEEVAKEAHKSAMGIAKQYVAAGGDWGDLGLEDPRKDKPEQKAENMPPASEHKGKVIRDTQTGKRYRSDGKHWIEIQ